MYFAIVMFTPGRNILQTKPLQTSFKDAASERVDNVMITRVGTEDLIAKDAVYHEICM